MVLLLALTVASPASAAVLPRWLTGGGSGSPARVTWSDGQTSDVLLENIRVASDAREPQQLGFREILPPRGSAGGRASVQPLPESVTPDRIAGGESLRTDLQAVRRIEFTPLRRIFFGSGTTAARVMPLGNNVESLPKPADWYCSWDDSELWRPAQNAPLDPRWTYLPHAAWVWSTAEWRPARAEEILLRQRFVLPDDVRVIRATLTLGADNQMLEGWLNGQPLPWRSLTLGGRTASASVERLLRPGANLLALHVAGPHTGELAAPGVAWSLVVEWTVPPRPLTPSGVPGASFHSSESSQSGAAALFADGCAPGTLSPRGFARLSDGGRVAFRSARVGESEVELRRDTPDGEHKMVFPRAVVRWIEQFPSALTRLQPSGELPSGALASILDDTREPEGVWLAGGSFLRGAYRGGAWGGDRFPGVTTMRAQKFTPAPDSTAPAVLAEVGLDAWPRAALISKAVPRNSWTSSPDLLTRTVRLTLLDGTVFEGLLLSSSLPDIEVQLPGSNTAEFDAGEVQRIEFPTATVLRARSAIESWHTPQQTTPVLGFLGDPSCGNGADCLESSVPTLQRIAGGLGATTRALRADDLLSAEIFSPASLPVLFNVDAQEAYWHSIKRPGDGHQALLQYLNAGGILVHLGQGTPLFYGRQQHGRRWSMVPLGGALNRAMGLHIVAPGDSAPGATAFESPDNTAEPLEFIRVATAPWDAGLPPRIEFPALTDSRFRPVDPVPQRAGARLIPLYRLRRGARDFGIAAAAVELPATSPQTPPGWTLYLAGPLVVSRDAWGNPTLETILPSLLANIAATRAPEAGK